MLMDTDERKIVCNERPSHIICLFSTHASPPLTIISKAIHITTSSYPHLININDSRIRHLTEMTTTNPTYFSNHSQRFTPLQTNSSSPGNATGQEHKTEIAKSSHFSNKILHLPLLYIRTRLTLNDVDIAGCSGSNTVHQAARPPITNQESNTSLPFLPSSPFVKRPVWEDPVNERGGKWIIRLKKGVVDRIWEQIVLAVIGDQFMPEKGTGAKNEYGVEDNWAPDEICGCTVSVRSNEDILAIWHKTGNDENIRLRIR
ncbi:9504_t:CDS:2 [Acaulospora colombiana]|uniref:9504_t:CDS:1 n=2 Tax=Acaulospora colombiana TaxID=27376 RepID=A0ACA9M997_9GLOM|nr:9501_t:CDS:2 [Acaulospora colombiana]CAG8577246.1 9504_t:CDS:2 [Acaulospora colombiana]